MLRPRPDTRAFYFSVINDYCQFQLHAGNASEAMLEAREMERIAGRAKSALDNCRQAEAYQDFFPSLRVKTRMTRAYLYNAEENWPAFWECYSSLVSEGGGHI